MGICQYFLIGKIPAAMFPKAGEYAAKSIGAKMTDLIGTRNLGLQVAWDQFVIMPALFLPIFYSVKTIGMTPEPTFQGSIEVTLTKWRENIWDDLQGSWKIWIPADIINFAFCPMHLRIPFMAVVSMVYTVVLSLSQGGKKPEMHDEHKKNAADFVSALPLTHDQEEMIKKCADHLGEAFGKTGKHELGPDGFKKLMHSLGVKEDKVIGALFAAIDHNNDGTLSASELSTTLLMFSGAQSSANLTGADRAAFVFEACDVDRDNNLTESELELVIRGMLNVREHLFVNGGDPNRSAAADLMVVKSVHSDTRDKKARLHQLAHDVYNNSMTDDISGMTMESILADEAKKLARTILEAADTDKSKGISKKEFSTWAEDGSKGSKRLMNLFTAFDQDLVRAGSE
jgi:Ca2+-binding EF-hand superfamily protein